MALPDDAEALTERGKELLSGPAPDTYEAIQLLNAAAHGTGGEAAAIVSVLAAAGAGTPQSWPNALDYLARAAKLGWPPAQAQLLILAADRALADQVRSGQAPDDAWRRLRHSVDIEAWLATPPSRALSESPSVQVFEGFVPEAFCDALVDMSRGGLDRARVYDPWTGMAVSDAARTNSTLDVSIAESNLLQVILRARIAAAIGVSLVSLEPPSILHYAVGQAFAPHFDFLEPDERGLAADLAGKGQRTATVLVYLNDGYDGGETAFPKLGLRFKGGKGEALWFANLDPAGAPDRRTLHAGLAPTSGEKWLFSQWIRGGPRSASA